MFLLCCNDLRRCLARRVRLKNVTVDGKKRLSPLELGQQQFTELLQSYTEETLGSLARQRQNVCHEANGKEDLTVLCASHYKKCTL